MTVRTVENDPFTPGYGVQPRVWAGRTGEFHEFDHVVLPRVRRGTYEQARLVTGNRGVGKTAFLAHLADDAQQAGVWTVRVDARRRGDLRADLAADVAGTVHARDATARVTDTLAGALRRVAGVQVTTSGVRLHLRRAGGDGGDPGRDLTAVLVEASRLARDAGAVMVVLIDELHNAGPGELGDLCHALQQAQTATDVQIGPRGEREHIHLPLVVYLAGLPGVGDQIRDAGATFFERVAHLDFGLLAAPDVREALVAFADNEGVGVDADALDALVAAVGGYPYFLHVYGSAVWTAGERGAVITLADVTQGLEQARRTVERFYADRVRQLSEKQHDWLLAAAALPPEDRTVGAIAARLGGRSSDYGWIAKSLHARGLTRPAPGRGRIEIALPGLDAYLAEHELS